MMMYQYADVSYLMILSQVEAMFDFPVQSNNKRTTTRRLVKIAILATIVLIMAVHYLLYAPSTTSRWIRSSSSLLVGISVIFLTLVVLVECTVRVILLKAGIISSLSITRVVSNPNHRCVLGRQNAALDLRIKRSLRREKLVHKPTKCETNTTSPSCCPVCLEEFQLGDTVVSGQRNCCKSNIFHDACIQQWLRISDSCPCCRKPMLVSEQEENGDEAFVENKPAQHESAESDIGSSEFDNNNNNNNISNAEDDNISSILPQFRIEFDIVNRMRNEILSYYGMEEDY